MQKINSSTIETALYNLCKQANIEFDNGLYEKILSEYNKAPDDCLKNILKNIELAHNIKRPLCQDTGQVIVFIEIGQNVSIDGISVYEAVNNGVKKAYTDNYFRKSVVKNALFDRTNTQTNTPAIIYTDLIKGDELNIKILIKGAGAENYSSLKMFKPSSSKTEIFEFIKNVVQTAGEKACPPIVLGIGAGGTMDSASVLSKKAFFNETQTPEEKAFTEELKEYLKDENVLDIKLISSSTHIACLPVAVTINCHSTRHASCRIKGNETEYEKSSIEYVTIPEFSGNIKEINTSEVEKIRNLKKGEKILLTGEIYTARDAAHKRMAESMPFDIKDKIIFYAGPCPAAPGEIIGPVGPTTSIRMDKFTELMYSNGLAATIGKGERSEEAEEIIKKYNGKYFSAAGGISCLLAQTVKSSEIVAFEDLGTEAIRKLYVEKLPVTVEI